MASRSTAIVEEVGRQVEGMRSNLPKLEEVVSGGGIEQAMESLGHLKACVASLDRAIEGEALRALPVLELTDIQKLGTNVANLLPQVIQNITGHHANFTSQVDALYRRLWVARLIDPDETERAFGEAAGKLTATLETARSHALELQKALQIRDQALAAAGEIETLRTQGTSHAATLAEFVSKTQGQQTEVQAAQKRVSQYGAQVEQLLNNAKEREGTLRTIEGELKKWHGEIDAKRKQIDALRESTDTRLTEYDNDVRSRQEELDRITQRIEEQFRLASSGALAKSFGERANALRRAKDVWGVLAFGSYVAAVACGFWLVTTTVPQPGSNAGVQAVDWHYFLVKLAVGVPVALLVWFTTVQFSRARRVQESYAFKGTVASSFDAYRELVEAIAKDGELRQNPEFARFITQTIEGLYKPPPMGNEEDDHLPQTKVFMEAAGLLKELGSLAAKLK